MKTGLTVAAVGMLLVGPVVIPAHADPPSYGSNGVFDCRRRGTRRLVDG